MQQIGQHLSVDEATILCSLWLFPKCIFLTSSGQTGGIIIKPVFVQTRLNGSGMSLLHDAGIKCNSVSVENKKRNCIYMCVTYECSLDCDFAIFW